MIGVAIAQSPADDFRGAEEIDVYGDLEVEQARHEVIEALHLEGYTEEQRREDYLLLRHSAAWRGEVRLYDDGWVIIKRQPVRFTPPDLGFAEAGSPLSWATCVLALPCLRAGGQLIGQRKFMGVETRTADAVAYRLEQLAGEIATASTADTVDALPARLEALWERGEPLEAGAPRLATYAERRLALFEYWDSRTNTEWGGQVRDAVEAFLRGVVQHSAHPYDASEIQALNARRRAERPFLSPRASGAP